MSKPSTQEDSIKYLLETFQKAETKEDFILAYWIFWVENVTIRAQDFRQVLASASVNHWFIMALQKEETEFRLLVNRYPEITGYAIDKLYIECVNKIMSRFPKALLDQAQKREEKPKTTKVQGIPTELAIIYQN